MSTSSGAAPVSPYDWIAFSIGRAKWVPFRTDREIDRAFNAPMPAADASHGPSSNYKLRLKNALEDEDLIRAAEKWIDDAQKAIAYYIIGKVVCCAENVPGGEGAARAAKFRSLGRGWIFILVDKPNSRFRW